MSQIIYVKDQKGEEGKHSKKSRGSKEEDLDIDMSDFGRYPSKTPDSGHKAQRRKSHKLSETEAFLDPTMTDLFKPDALIRHEGAVKKEDLEKKDELEDGSKVKDVTEVKVEEVKDIVTEDGTEDLRKTGPTETTPVKEEAKSEPTIEEVKVGESPEVKKVQGESSVDPSNSVKTEGSGSEVKVKHRRRTDSEKSDKQRVKKRERRKKLFGTDIDGGSGKFLRTIKVFCVSYFLVYGKSSLL